MSEWRDVPTAAWLDTKVEFDQAGNVVKRTDPKTQATTITYAQSPCTGFADTHGFATSILNSKSHEVKVEYDCWTGKPVKITDPNNKNTTATYADTMDRLKTIGYADGGSKSYDYLDTTNTITETTGLDSCLVASMTRSTIYDGLGRVVEGRFDDGGGQITTTTAYDGLGRVSKAHVPKRAGEAAAWTETLYDGLGRPLTVTSGCTTVVAGGCVAGSTQNPNATAITYSYSTSSTGLATTTVAPGSKRMRHDRDGFGRLIKAVEDPLGLNLETTYTNDLLDRLTQVTQGVQTRSISYDSLGRMVSTTQPESGVTGFGYDDNGNLTGRTDGRGYAAIYGYDSLNRIVSKTYSKPAPPQGQAAYPDTTTAAFLWDTIFKGQMTNAVTSLNGAEVSRTENLSFDDMGRVTGSKQTTGGTISTFAYGYNKAGLLSSMTYPSGRVVASCYNSGGSPKKVTGTLGTTVTTYADGAGYASHGALASLTVGPSYAMTMGYNTHHRQLKTTEYKLGTSTLFKSSLFYCAGEADGCADNNGNVVTQKSHDGAVERVQSYTYDALNRLATGTETGGFSQTHSYDRYGNRWMSAGSSMPYGAAQTPTAATEYEASTNRYVGGSRSYDLAGNMRSEGGATAGYDGEGRLVEAMFPWGTGPVTTLYVYDAEGRRVKKTNPSIGTVVYVYDAFGQLAAEHGAGSTAGCDTCYLLTDHLGTTRAVGDKNGAVVKRRDHMPFGEEVVAPWLNGRGAV
ncbi:MAG: RHS repeat protein, partial [Bryobacterales bacterium]|nr:RHS repeat protein [Bryobacterales bacterium]